MRAPTTGTPDQAASVPEQRGRARTKAGPAAWTGHGRITTSNGMGGWAHSRWHVKVSASPDGRVSREVWEGDKPLLWNPKTPDWTPEQQIWPCAVDSIRSGQADVVPKAAPLQGVHDVLTATTERVRETARWMASVLGVTLAALVGTSPLTQMPDASERELALAAGGLLCLAATLLLVLRVLQPASVDYLEVQLTPTESNVWGRLFPAQEDADSGHPTPRPRRGVLQSPLLRWKSTVESQQDLYLPCGIKCLTSLRRATIVEEVTLAALADADPLPCEPPLAERLTMARSARAARLRELREAAACVAQVGELYVIRRRSAWAAYVGGPLACLGTALIVGAFVGL